MKQAAFTLLPLSLVLCLVCTDHALCQSTHLTIQSDSSQLSSDVIQSAFGVLGLTFERFTYEAPSSHELRFQILEYRKGRLEKSSPGTPYSMGSGKQSFTVYFHNSAESIIVSVECDQRRDGFAAVPLEKLNALAWGTFEDAIVDPSGKTPVIGFAASSNSITGFDTSESPDVIASHYDLFVVVVAQVEMK